MKLKDEVIHDFKRKDGLMYLFSVGPLTPNNLLAVHRSHVATASVLGVMYLLISAGIFMRCEGLLFYVL